MEREFCLTMIQKSIHALGVRIHKCDGELILYPIAKVNELMPCW